MALILIMDDSFFHRAFIREVVQEEGYEFIEAKDGIEGLQTITSQPPDCILMDLLMPKMNGLEFLKIIRDRGYNIPIIVLTADIQSRVRKQCMELGANGFIEKPPDRNELIKEIKKAFDSGEGL